MSLLSQLPQLCAAMMEGHRVIFTLTIFTTIQNEHLYDRLDTRHGMSQTRLPGAGTCQRFSIFNPLDCDSPKYAGSK